MAGVVLLQNFDQRPCIIHKIDAAVKKVDQGFIFRQGAHDMRVSGQIFLFNLYGHVLKEP